MGLVPVKKSGVMSAIMQAVDYAGMGFSVIPLKPRSKVPITRHGIKDATKDNPKIIKWQKKWPNANVGIATGKPSNVIALDVDRRNGGLESFADLTRNYGAIIGDTLTADTGGGGFHIYFKLPSGVQLKTSHGALGAGIDLQSNGAYCVAAQSIHPNGKPYVWRDDLYQPALIPDALLGAILNSQKKENRPTFNLPALIADGARNDVLFRYAASLRGHGQEFDPIHESISRVNTERCTRPLCEDELIRIATSATKYAKNKRHGLHNLYRQEIAKSELPCPSRMILSTLLIHADTETLTAFPEQETIAQESGISREAVRQHTNKLDALGWLGRNKNQRTKGKQGWRYSYTLTFPERLQS